MYDADNIIEVTRTAVSNIARIDNAIDEALTPIKDYTDTIADVVSPIRAIAGFYSLAKRRKFKSFLSAYAKKVNSGIPVEEIVQRIKPYLANPKNIELIAEIIDSAINAKSVNCSTILGYFAGEILSESKETEYKDFIVINALESLIDDDLDYFLRLYEHIPADKRYEKYRVCNMAEELYTLNLDIFRLEVTLEKLKNTHIVGFDIGGHGNVGNAWGSFLFNENTDYFYSIVKRSGVVI